MIKISAINGITKKAALGAMLFSSVAMFASNPIKNEKTETQPKTEVVSKDGAEALKAITFPMLQQNSKVPTTHNKALDEKFLKFCKTPEEKKMVNDFIDNIYKEHGSYLGSATIQQNLDLNIFLEFLDGNIEILKKFDEKAYNKIDKESMKKVTEKSEPIKKWLNENYFNVYNQPFGKFDHPPDYKEVNVALDDYIEKDPYKLFEDRTDKYNYRVEHTVDYLKKSNMDIVQKNSNLIATKVQIADEILFINLLKSAGLYKGYEDLNVVNNLFTYLGVVCPVRYDK